jgi:hypothetical protein
VRCALICSAVLPVEPLDELDERRDEELFEELFVVSSPFGGPPPPGTADGPPITPPLSRSSRSGA